MKAIPIFVSFEGGEASGKSVQARRLSEALVAHGFDALLVREPGGTRAGERIRELLLHAPDAELHAEAEALLFMAARAQLVREVIRPALAKGRVVIADRFVDSTFVYQGLAGGADMDGLRATARLAVGDTMPSRTYLLDVPVEVVMARGSGRSADRPWDRFESRDAAYHRLVRDAYLRLAAAEPGRFVVQRGDRDEADIAAEILLDVEALLGSAQYHPAR